MWCWPCRAAWACLLFPVLRHSGKISKRSGYHSTGNVLLQCPGTLPAWKCHDIISSHNSGFCPLSITQMIFSYEWKWKSKWEGTKSPTKTPSPRMGGNFFLCVHLKMWKYITIQAWKQPFSPAHSSVSDISHSNQYIMATKCRFFFYWLLKYLFWAQDRAVLAPGIRPSFSRACGRYVLIEPYGGGFCAACAGRRPECTLGSPRHKNPWSFAAVVSFHFAFHFWSD